MPDRFDIIMENGTLVDGTGAPARRADIGIGGDKIAAVTSPGALAGASAARRIDAAGKIVCPGFIDAHCHTDAYAEHWPDAEGKIMQGVTTDVCGLCGTGPAPIGTGHLEEYSARNRNFLPDGKEREIEAISFGRYLEDLRARGNSTNMALFTGNGNLRIHAAGYADRPADSAAMEAMKDMLRRSMDEGAFGLSTGLTYVPSRFAPTEELIELCRVMRPYGGIYNSHMRDESDRVAESVAEVIGIAEKSGCRGHVSHLKAMGLKNHGRAGECLELIERANGRGVPVAFDVYPYTAGSTALKTLLPDRILAETDGGFAALRGKKSEISRYLEGHRTAGDDDRENIVLLCGSDKVVVSAARGLAAYEGKSLMQIAEELRGDPCDALIAVLEETDGQADMIYHSMSEEDVRTFMKSRYCMIGTDAYARHYEGPTASGKPHPRNYGGFPRYLRRYVLDGGLLSPEEGIHRITGLPAETFALKKRGILKEGYYADITIFDPANVADTATWEKPAQKPLGIEYVLIGGRPAVDRGEAAHIRAGKGLMPGV